MKKISFLLVILIMSTALVGCGNKEKITTDDFVAIANEFNYDTTSTSDTYRDINVKAGTMAVFSGACSIEFVEFESNEDAVYAFDTVKSLFSSYEEKANKHTSVDLENYDKYMVSTDLYYMYVSRIDNTLVYANTINLHKDDVAEFIDKMGY